jgi:hypothetical protein
LNAALLLVISRKKACKVMANPVGLKTGNDAIGTRKWR